MTDKSNVVPMIPGHLQVQALAKARELGRQEMLVAVCKALGERSVIEARDGTGGNYVLNRLWHVITAEGFGEP